MCAVACSFNLTNLAWIGGVSLNANEERLKATFSSGSYIYNPPGGTVDPFQYATYLDWYESLLSESELSVICERIESYYVTMYTPLSGQAFAAPQVTEITSVFWDLDHAVDFTLSQDQLYQGSRSLTVLVDVGCSNCDPAALHTTTFQLHIDGEDEALYVDVVGGTVLEHLVSENAEHRVPLYVSLPSNFMIECPTGLYSSVTGSCYDILFAGSHSEAVARCAADFDPHLANPTPALAILDLDADAEMKELKLLAAVYGNLRLLAFLDDEENEAADAAAAAAAAVTAGDGNVDDDDDSQAGLYSEQAWKTYFYDDVYRPESGEYPFICERQGQVFIDITDGWTGVVAPQIVPEPAGVVFSTADWHATQTTEAYAVDDLRCEPFLQITTYVITVNEASLVDLVWHRLTDSEDLKVLDDDVAELMVTPMFWAVSADGDFNYTVRLATQPVYPVQVEVAQANASSTLGDVFEPFAFGPQVLTFTVDNWAQPQTVSVRAGVRTDLTNRTYLPEYDPSKWPPNNTIFPYRFTIPTPWPNISDVLQYTTRSEDVFYNGTRFQVRG